MTTVAIIQARMGSTRLPGKVLMDLAGTEVLAWVIRAARDIVGVDKVVVATSVLSQDDQISEWCEGADVTCHRGPEADVLTRYAIAAKAEAADIVLRLTADCPLLDPHVCGQVLALLKHQGADYASNAEPRRWPDGLDCEAMTAEALYQADREASRDFEREHVTPYLRENRGKMKTAFLNCPIPGISSERWTLDTAEDFAFLEKIARLLPRDAPPSYMAILGILASQPELANQQASLAPAVGGNAGPISQAPAYTFTKSNQMLRRAVDTIPLGTQTFSKAYTQFPREKAPLFLSHGRGGRVWDIDGNEYVDLICGLMPIVLGYCDADVDAAIEKQLAEGISFSLASGLEAELAERLVEIIPCAEMVRFGKNGSDATSAAIRLSRAFTGRDHIAVCGYHGWHDWYIGATTRDKGVPASVQQLTHKFPYNDLAALDQLLSSRRGEFAAVIMEPMSIEEPAPGYLEQVRELAHEHGALLVFDEIVTGFHFALGGAQELFGVTPDLAAFGKALGNGMPISAIVGRADVMIEMEEIFFSGTFGGEALSLAAAIAVIDKMRREPVIESLWRTGANLADSVCEEIAAHGLSDVFSLRGMAPWKVLQIGDHPNVNAAAIKTVFLREMLSNGVLIGTGHNICQAHDDADLATVTEAYRRSLDLIANKLDDGSLWTSFDGPPIKPVFSVR
jgi:glutamate-1-semialdehyde 2,1-aminomutase